MSRGSLRAAAAAVAVLAAGGAVVAAAVVVPADRATTWLADAGLSAGTEPAPARSVAPSVTSSALACPAAPALVGDTAGTDQDFSAQPVPTVARVRALADTASTSDLLVAPLVREDGTPTLGAPVPATPSGDVSLARADGTGAVAVTGAPAGSAPAAPTAVASAVTTAGDLRGLSTGVCTRPASTAWLVGGGVDVGRTNRLVLSNPGATPAVVDVSVLTGGLGRVDAPAGQGVLVPAGQVREVLVDGLVAADPAIAVGVTASGGTVAASLVDAAVSGITPRGVDVVTPTEASVRQVLPGVTAGDAAVLRLAVPGDQPAVVGWRLEGVAGPVPTTTASATTVPAGSVVDVPLDLLADGVASVVVESDVPVLAAVQTSRGSAPETGGAVDRAWVPAAPALDDDTELALPAEGVVPWLVVSAGLPVGSSDGEVGPAAVTVVPVRADGSDGTPVELAVQPGTTSLVAGDELSAAVGVRLRVASGSVHVGVLLSAASVAGAGADLVSALAVPRAAGAPADVVLVSPPPGSWP